jgi:hypothetical protein
MLTRRQFLNRGALLAAGGLALPPWARWLGEQVEKLQPKKHVFVYQPSLATIQYVYGQPGLFRDVETGQIITIREYRESDDQLIALKVS